MYLSLVAQVPPATTNETHQSHLSRIFASFPDSWSVLRDNKLAYFSYTAHPDDSVSPHDHTSLDDLVERKAVDYSPIVYEDFLPLSAAGIFQSNLDSTPRSILPGRPDKAGFEVALGEETMDQFGLYARVESDSIAQVCRALGCKV